MTFCEQLNTYIKQIGCSSKELVNASGPSTSVISRYRRGDRSPNIRGKQLCQTGSCHCSGKHHADCFFHGFPPKNYSFFVWDAAHLSFPDCTLIISGKPDLINVFPLLKDGFY